MRKKSTQDTSFQGSEAGFAAASARVRKVQRPRKPKAVAVAASAFVSAVAEHWSDAEREEIARLAYFYWEERGRPDGSHEVDWYRAEREVQARRTTNER